MARQACKLHGDMAWPMVIRGGETAEEVPAVSAHQLYRGGCRGWRFVHPGWCGGRLPGIGDFVLGGKEVERRSTGGCWQLHPIRTHRGPSERRYGDFGDKASPTPLLTPTHQSSYAPSHWTAQLSGIRVYGSPFPLSFTLSPSLPACSNGLHTLHSLFIHLNIPPIVCSMRPVSGSSLSLCD